MTDSLEIFDTDNYAIQLAQHAPPKIDTTISRREKEKNEGQEGGDNVDYKHLRRESSLTEVVEILNAVEQAKYVRRNGSTTSDDRNHDDDYETYFSESDIISPSMTPGNITPNNNMSPVSSNEVNMKPSPSDAEPEASEKTKAVAKKKRGIKKAFSMLKGVFKKKKETV
jgi:hypothetical protein